VAKTVCLTYYLFEFFNSRTKRGTGRRAHGGVTRRGEPKGGNLEGEPKGGTLEGGPKGGIGGV